MVFSLLRGTLPLVISWSDKYLDIMDQFELSEFVYRDYAVIPDELDQELVRKNSVNIKNSLKAIEKNFAAAGM